MPVREGLEETYQVWEIIRQTTQNIKRLKVEIEKLEIQMERGLVGLIIKDEFGCQLTTKEHMLHIGIGNYLAEGTKMYIHI